jgi:muramoyltetrapeptide carboxypeptidase
MPLQNGCKIGIAASSSSFKREEFDKAINFIRMSGYEPVYSDAVFNKQGFMAGTPEERAKDLVALINNDDIKAIFFARGGYGSVQILPLISKKDLRKKLNGKIIMGYSDVTSLYCHLWNKYKIPLLYGPNIISRHFNSKIFEYLSSPSELKINIEVLRPGKAAITAPFFGGCLSVLASMAGTSYLKPLKGHILFIEDTNEPPYKLDRMLTQLLMSGTISGVKAIAVGSMENCDTPPYTWRDAVLRIADQMNVPVITGINAGHGLFDYPLPMGIKAKIDFTSCEFLIYSPFKKKNNK